jgi:hypothetical protein
MPVFKRTLSEFLFRRFMLKNYSSNLLVDMNLEAKRETFDYIKVNMTDAPYFEKHQALVKYAIEQVSTEGLYLEFGVGRGKSMRWIAPLVDGPVHGFDSFEGIQEHWNGNPIGSFAQKKRPKVPDNVLFHVGFFDATLPGFLETYEESVAFLHIDCDLYSSTVTIFDALGLLQLPSLAAARIQGLPGIRQAVRRQVRVHWILGNGPAGGGTNTRESALPGLSVPTQPPVRNRGDVHRHARSWQRHYRGPLLAVSCRSI